MFNFSSLFLIKFSSKIQQQRRFVKYFKVIFFTLFFKKKNSETYKI